MNWETWKLNIYNRSTRFIIIDASVAAAESCGELLTGRICDADVCTTEGKVAGNHADFLTTAPKRDRRFRLPSDAASHAIAIYNAELRRLTSFALLRSRARTFGLSTLLTSHYHIPLRTHSPNKLRIHSSRAAASPAPL